MTTIRKGSMSRRAEVAHKQDNSSSKQNDTPIKGQQIYTKDSGDLFDASSSTPSAGLSGIGTRVMNQGSGTPSAIGTRSPALIHSNNPLNLKNPNSNLTKNTNFMSLVNPLDVTLEEELGSDLFQSLDAVTISPPGLSHNGFIGSNAIGGSIGKVGFGDTRSTLTAVSKEDRERPLAPFSSSISLQGTPPNYKIDRGRWTTGTVSPISVEKNLFLNPKQQPQHTNSSVKTNFEKSQLDGLVFGGQGCDPFFDTDSLFSLEDLDDYDGSSTIQKVSTKHTEDNKTIVENRKPDTENDGFWTALSGSRLAAVHQHATDQQHQKRIFYNPNFTEEGKDSSARKLSWTEVIKGFQHRKPAPSAPSTAPSGPSSAPLYESLEDTASGGPMIRRESLLAAENLMRVQRASGTILETLVIPSTINPIEILKSTLPTSNSRLDNCEIQFQLRHETSTFKTYLVSGNATAIASFRNHLSEYVKNINASHSAHGNRILVVIGPSVEARQWLSVHGENMFGGKLIGEELQIVLDEELENQAGDINEVSFTENHGKPTRSGEVYEENLSNMSNIEEEYEYKREDFIEESHLAKGEFPFFKSEFSTKQPSASHNRDFLFDQCPFPLRFQMTLHIEKSFHPFLYGVQQGTLKAIMGATRTRIQFPGHADAQNANRIIVAGERAADVIGATGRLIAVYEEKLKSTRLLTLQVPKKLHKFLIGAKGAGLQDVLARTGCALELPLPSDPSDIVLIRGAETSLVKAVAHVMEKANAMAVHTVPLTPLQYKYLSLRERPLLRELEQNATTELHILLTPSVLELQGAKQDVHLALPSIQKRLTYLSACQQVSLPIPPPLHKHIIGRRGHHIARFHDLYDVDIIVPNENESSQDVLLVGQNMQNLEIVKRELLAICGAIQHNAQIVQADYEIQAEKQASQVEHQGSQGEKQGSQVEKLIQNIPTASNLSKDGQKMPQKQNVSYNYARHVPYYAQEGSSDNSSEVNRIMTGNKMQDAPQSIHSAISKHYSESILSKNEPVSILHKHDSQLIRHMMPVPARYHASLIGKQGKHVKQIYDNYQVTVRFKNDEAQLEGAHENVFKVKQLILNRIEKQNSQILGNFNHVANLQKNPIAQYDGSTQDKSQFIMSTFGKVAFLAGPRGTLTSLIEELEETFDTCISIHVLDNHVISDASSAPLEASNQNVASVLSIDMPVKICCTNKAALNHIKSLLEELKDCQIKALTSIPASAHPALIGSRGARLRDILKPSIPTHTTPSSSTTSTSLTPTLSQRIRLKFPRNLIFDFPNAPPPPSNWILLCGSPLDVSIISRRLLDAYHALLQPE